MPYITVANVELANFLSLLNIPLNTAPTINK